MVKVESKPKPASESPSPGANQGQVFVVPDIFYEKEIHGDIVVKKDVSVDQPVE